jgi:hypothetical protein
MPAVEVALAERVMVLVTVAPAVGKRRTAEMPVVLIVKDTGTYWGEPVAPEAEIVAVALSVPIERPVGFTTNAREVVAPPFAELDAGEKVSHDCVELADQLRTVEVPAVFAMTTDCDEVAVLPWTAEKVRVEVGTESVAGFATVREMGEEEAVFP